MLYAVKISKPNIYTFYGIFLFVIHQKTYTFYHMENKNFKLKTQVLVYSFKKIKYYYSQTFYRYPQK